MLQSLNKLKGYRLRAKDGEIGRCKDFLFDDRDWVVRYAVTDTCGWLPGSRKVVISPVAITQTDWENRVLPVNLTQRQVEESPPLEKHQPVSRQYEETLFAQLGYGFYWMGPDLWGPFPEPASLMNKNVRSDMEGVKGEQARRNHLRSAREVKGYLVQAEDASIGRVSDFILNDTRWTIDYLVIKTRRAPWRGRQVVIPAESIKAVDWLSHQVSVSLTKEQIENNLAHEPGSNSISSQEFFYQ